MIKKLIKAAVVASFVVLLPILGNVAILRAPQIWILWALGILAAMLQPDYNPFTITVKPRDRGTGAQIIWSVYITQVAAVLECAYLRYPESIQWNAAVIAAMIGIILGLALRTWSVATLGSLFTMHISIQKQHTVVRRGPYRIVRHPSYLGAFIMYVCSTALLQAWFAMIIALVILPFAFVRRISYEEAMLRGELGQEYQEYCSRVKRLLPGIW
jgi:protein-S-isoprenylcysteine O-methyltransferase